MDWNSDGLADIVSGDRSGYFNAFTRNPDSTLTACYQYRLADSTVLNVGSNSQPAAVDWNGDGRKDLLLGTEAGYVRFYPNIGGDTWPAFQNYTNVTAGGSPIFLNRVNPYVFDLDRDGVRDLICGANDGYVRFYRNTGSDSNPVLAAAETLRAANGALIRPLPPNFYGSRCGFGYWDADSLPDFLLSGYDGLILLYRGAPFTGQNEPRAAAGPRPAIAAAPNPFRTVTTIRCGVPGPLTVVDVAGRPVRVLSVASGAGSTEWDGRDTGGRAVAAGVYFVRAGVEQVRVQRCR